MADEKDYNRIREWIEPLLEKRQMSIEQLANQADLTRTSVYFWLDDKCRPSEGSMAKICRILGRPLAEGLAQYTPRKAGRPFGWSPSTRGLTVRQRGR